MGVIESNSKSHSTEMRLSMYNIAPSLILKHPIFGSGWGYFTEYSGLKVYSHSNYIELLVTFGALGFILYYWIYIYIIIISLKKRHRNEIALVLGVVISILITDTSIVSFTEMIINYIMILWSMTIIKELGEIKDDKEIKKNNL